MDPFVHCHTHSEYSILDGAAKIDALIRAAIEDGMPAISSTDHGNMYGCYEFYKRCNKAGIKYIPGEEFYMAKESRLERPKKGKKKVDDLGGETEQGEKLYYHITLLAETTAGFHNMIKLSSKAFLEGFYHKPRVDWEMLEEFHEGIIATSGCLGGVVLQALLNGDMDLAKERAGRLQTIFGRDNFFMEIQDHGLQEQIKTNPMLIEIGKYLNAPILATNDSHYVHAKDALAHDALICVQTGSLIADENRFKFSGTEHYLKSSAEMRHLFQDIPSSCDNTLWIAERSNVVLESPGYKLPRFPVPDGYLDDKTYLHHLVYEGAKRRWGVVSDETRARIDFELEVVGNMGFSSYFLILWDIVATAHKNDIATGPGRGSAAGSAVSYCLGITELDPIKYDLLFERFLNPSRISMPDIDLDIDSRYRDFMIKYTAEKYGEDRVAQIITFNQMKGRAAVRDAARVLGHNYGVGDRIAKAMPPVVMGRDTPLWACLTPDDEHMEGYNGADSIREMYKYEDVAHEVIDIALGLEGLRRSDGIHAAAVVISDKPLVEYLPIQRKGEGKPIVTQYEMNNVEELGLLKIDYLALRNIDTIDIAQKLIKSQGIDIDVNALPLDDNETYRLLQSGETLGIFQLESSQLRELLRRLAPSEFKDIGALVALYRPGPMASNMHNDYVDRKNGRQYIEYFHEDAVPTLQDTYGLMIYQEQMMRIAQKFAGYSLAEADNLRKACGKKIRAMMAKEKDKLIAGVIEQGYGEKLAHYLWDMIEPFADYCVTGDTELKLGASGPYSNGVTTVGGLYRRLHNILPPVRGRLPAGESSIGNICLECSQVPSVKRGLCLGCYAWHQKFHSKGLTILAYSSDGRIRPERLKTVVCNGVKPVYEMTLANGFQIKSTDNHRYLTTNGYTELKDISVGDLVVVHTGLDVKSRFTNEDHRTTIGTRKSRGYIDGGFIKFKEWTSSAPNECEKCGHDGSIHRLERSHLNGNRTCNEPWNLAILCVSCHKKHDYRINNRAKRFDKGHLSNTSGVVSIRYVGEEITYDVVMDSIEHNFIGNGIVTHNSFNKSHAYSYGYIAYQTAYLKANYPLEYMTALLACSPGDDIRLGLHMAECKKFGIEVLPPNLNLSESSFRPLFNESKILFGLDAIKNVNEGVADAIIVERDKLPFSSFVDFVERMTSNGVNKKSLENFVLGGACDMFEFTRKAMADRIADIQKIVRKKIKDGDNGIMSLFPTIPMEMSDSPEYDPKERLSLEKTALGVYISDHPLNNILDIYKDESITAIAELWESNAEIVGMVSGTKPLTTKKGDKMAIFYIEDLTGKIEVVVFPKTFKQYGSLVKDDNILKLNGRIDTRDEHGKFIVQVLTQVE